MTQDTGRAPQRKRADAVRNEKTLLDAAAAIFVTSGVEAPVRDIAAKAGVGTGTIYRHFPTRADLIIAVYRHQIEACAQEWIGLFVDFLVTKHGLAVAFQADNTGFDAMHHYFLDRLLPVAGQLIDAAVAAGEIQPGITPLELMRAVGNLCIGDDLTYNARRMVALLIAGLLQKPPA
jgi:AcrR family transcriptional regulator